MTNLDNVVAKALRKPYEWGVDDCLLFAGDASKAQTGHDPLGQFRGKWSSKREAYAIIVENGGDLVRTLELLAPQVGWKETDPASAVTGDMGVIIEHGTPSVACRIEQGWLLRGEHGVSVRPTVLKAWSVQP